MTGFKALTASPAASGGGRDGAGERWVDGLSPAAPGAAERLLLCDGCFRAAAGLLAEGQDGCTRDPVHDGLCLRDSPEECQWCGAAGPAPRSPASRGAAPPAHGGRRRRRHVAPALRRRRARPVPLGPGGLGLLTRQRRRRDPRPVPGQPEGGTVKTRFDKIGYPLYCDAGPHEGDTRIDLTISLYLSPQEYASYEGPESLRITLAEPGSEPAGAGGARPPDHPLPAPAAPGEPASHSASTAKENADGRP